MRIGIDAMGGDFAPLECVKGIVAEAKAENNEFQFFVFGEK